MTDQTKPAETSTFVQVVQPNYIWREEEIAGGEGRVILPTAKDDIAATIITPAGNSPAARVNRVQKLLHARHTPEVVAISRKLTKHGVSAVSIGVAEDIRLSKVAEAKKIYDIVDAHIDDEVVEAYLHGVARLHGRATPSADRYAHFTTGKAVQAALGLIPHPVKSESIDKTSIKSILEAVEASLGGAATWEKVNIEKAQDIFDEARVGIDKILTSDTYRGTKAVDARFTDIANLIEDTLRRAYGPPPPEGGKGGDGDGDGDGKGEGEGEGNESAAASSGEGSSGSGSSGGESAPGSDSAGPDKNAEGSDERPERTAPEKAEPPPAPSSGRPKASRPQFKDRGTSPLTDVLPPLRKLKRASAPLLPSPTSDAMAGAVASVAQAHERRGDAQASISDADGAVVVTNNILLADYSLNTHIKNWGKMTIHMAPLVRSKKNLAPRRGRAGADGTLPRHFHRWFSDREILDTKGRRPGGTLLIDGSGSMSWSLERTRKLIELCPALTVAVYSSKVGAGNTEGVLTILARNGRACDPNFDYRSEFKHAGGNVVDGPALEWLCQQPGPRVWFSDGQVSGASESFTSNFLFDAFRLACAGQVTRTISYKAVVAVLSGKLKPFPVTPGEIASMKSSNVHQHFRDLSTRDQKLEERLEGVIKEFNIPDL